MKQQALHLSTSEEQELWPYPGVPGRGGGEPGTAEDSKSRSKRFPLKP